MNIWRGDNRAGRVYIFGDSQDSFSGFGQSSSESSAPPDSLRAISGNPGKVRGNTPTLKGRGEI